MSNSYKISVIVPIYKVEAYLKKCLDSIITQSYHNIEIILVDDGSPDNCGTICDEYAYKDNRIIVIHKKNGGLSSARNAGLDNCSGDYIMFVDSDDWIEENFCEKALNNILEKKVDCLVFGYFKHENNQIITKATNNPRYLSSEKAILSIIKLDDIIFNFAWNKIYCKKVFKEIRFPEGRLFEDQGTTYKIFDLVGKIYVLDSPLYHYITRDGSIMSNKYKPQAINDKFDLWVERLAFIKHNYPSIYKDQLKKLVIFIIDALLILGWNKNKNLRSKLELFLKEYKIDIINLNMKSKFLFLFYYLHPLYCFVLLFLKRH